MMQMMNMKTMNVKLCRYLPHIIVLNIVTVVDYLRSCGVGTATGKYDGM